MHINVVSPVFFFVIGCQGAVVREADPIRAVCGRQADRGERGPKFHRQFFVYILPKANVALSCMRFPTGSPYPRPAIFIRGRRKHRKIRFEARSAVATPNIKLSDRTESVDAAAYM